MGFAFLLRNKLGRQQRLKQRKLARLHRQPVILNNPPVSAESGFSAQLAIAHCRFWAPR